MPVAAETLAFILPSGSEWVVIVVVGILLFGRRLPEVGRTIGRTMAQLRQGYHKFKAEIDLDGDVGRMRDSLRETRESIADSVGSVPRIPTDPKMLLTDLTDEDLSTPGPLGEIPPWGAPDKDEPET